MLKRVQLPEGSTENPRAVVKTVVGFYERIQTRIPPAQTIWLELSKEEFDALVAKGARVLTHKTTK